MRLSTAVCAICVLLAARAEALPQPTSEHPAPVERREPAEKPKGASAVLGQEYYQAVSPNPIPTPVPAAFGDTFMDILNADSDDGPIKTNRHFEFCANEGEGLPSCFCNGIMRYGSTGDKHARLLNPKVPMWSYRRSCGNVDCAARNFDNEDPFPGQIKQCQCSPPIPTPTPDPSQLKWTFCAADGGTCQCGSNSVVRFGSTGSSDLYKGGSNPTFFADHPEVTKWTYRQTPERAAEAVACKVSSFPTDPWPGTTRQSGQKMICQCAAYPPLPEEACTATPTPKHTFTPSADVVAQTVDDSVPRPWEITWTFCANEGEPCNCLGVVRYGHSGDYRMYADKSAWFKKHPNVYKWVNKESNGSLMCKSSDFGNMEPFPNHKKLCQCAHGVSIDVFEPFSVSDEEVRDGETKPKALIPVTPQIVLTTTASTDAMAMLGNHKRHIYHHRMQPKEKHLEARDLAGFSEEELELLHRSDEIAAMKAATAAIAAGEGELPLLPGERAHLGVGKVEYVHPFANHEVANLGLAAPGGDGTSSLRVAAGVAVTVVAISGMVMVARLKKRQEVILADMTKPLVGAEEGRLQLYT